MGFCKTTLAHIRRRTAARAGTIRVCVCGGGGGKGTFFSGGREKIQKFRFSFFIDVKPFSTCFRHIFFIFNDFYDLLFLGSFDYDNASGRCFTRPLGRPVAGS